MELTNYEKQIHETAMRISNVHARSEVNLIRVLQEVDRIELYKKFDRCGSSFEYIVNVLNKTPPTAYMLIAVSRKCAEVPALAKAIQANRITVPLAHRLCSQIRNETRLSSSASPNRTRTVRTK